MAIRSKLTVRGVEPSPTASAERQKREFSEEERATRKQRVQRAKDALARSAHLKGDHVTAARQAIKLYLQRLNDPRQPTDEQFEALVDAPFRQPPKRREGGGRR